MSSSTLWHRPAYMIYVAEAEAARGETEGSTYFPLLINPALHAYHLEPNYCTYTLPNSNVTFHCYYSTTPHPRRKLSDTFKCSSHSSRSSGNAISSHGFRGPLKCRTAENCSSSASGICQPRPGKCHNGSIACTRPSNAIRAGGSDAIFHSLKSDSRFCTSHQELLSV